MSWEKDADTDKIVFYCDSVSDCKSVFTSVHGDFLFAWKAAQADGWRSFKRRVWNYFCPKCAADAEIAYRRFIREEQERERIKARNAY